MNVHPSQVSVVSTQADSGEFSDSKMDDVNTIRMRLLSATALCTILVVVCWAEHRSLRSLQSNLSTHSKSIKLMYSDVQRIRALSHKPMLVTTTRKSNDQLLAEIEAALSIAAIPLEKWQDSVPLPAQSVPESNLVRMATRMYLEDVDLESFARFCRSLIEADNTLSVESTRISEFRSNGKDWVFEITVTYYLAT